jgi:hypothetical protein
MASAGMPTWARPRLPMVWPRAFYFSFQAEDAFLPVRAALNVETCQLQSLTAPAALPTSEMTWENRFFFIVGHNGPAPYLIRHPDDIKCAILRRSRDLSGRDCSGLCLLCIAASCLLSVFIIMCRDPTCRDAHSTTAVCFSFLFPGS